MPNFGTDTLQIGEVTINVPCAPQNAAEFAAYYTEERVAELREAFDLVCNSRNWKLPIEGIEIDASNAAIVSEAIEFMGGGRARFVLTGAETGKISAPGYYAAIGA